MRESAICRKRYRVCIVAERGKKEDERMNKAQ